MFAFSIAWTIALSVLVTILLSFPLFALDIRWEKLTEIAGMSGNKLMHNYAVLMEYLFNPFRAKLRMPDFPDSDGALKHFSEVKVLFLFVALLVIVLIPVVYKFLKKHLQLLFKRGIILAMLVPVILAVFTFTVGFDNFFILFHQLLFRDKTWLFDPTTDPIINVLTDNFFMYCFIIFAIIYEGILTASLINRRIIIKSNGKKK